MKTPVFNYKGSALMTFSNPNYLPKAYISYLNCTSTFSIPHYEDSILIYIPCRAYSSHIETTADMNLGGPGVR
jgi:hypothetical protein